MKFYLLGGIVSLIITLPGYLITFLHYLNVQTRYKKRIDNINTNISELGQFIEKDTDRLIYSSTKDSKNFIRLDKFSKNLNWRLKDWSKIVIFSFILSWIGCILGICGIFSILMDALKNKICPLEAKLNALTRSDLSKDDKQKLLKTFLWNTSVKESKVLSIESNQIFRLSDIKFSKDHNETSEYLIDPSTRTFKHTFKIGYDLARYQVWEYSINGQALNVKLLNFEESFPIDQLSLEYVANNIPNYSSIKEKFNRSSGDSSKEISNWSEYIDKSIVWNSGENEFLKYFIMLLHPEIITSNRVGDLITMELENISAIRLEIENIAYHAGVQVMYDYTTKKILLSGLDTDKWEHIKKPLDKRGLNREDLYNLHIKEEKMQNLLASMIKVS